MLTVYSSIGQTINQISNSQFEDITINSVSLSEIIKSNGNIDKIPKSLGKPEKTEMSKNEKAPSSSSIDYDGLHIGFSGQINAKGNLSRIDITKASIILKVMDSEFYVGKDISNELSKYKINQKKDGGRSIVFSPENDSTMYLAINVDDKNTVTDIVYFVLT